MKEVIFRFENLDEIKVPRESVTVNIHDPSNIGKNNMSDVSGVDIEIDLDTCDLDEDEFTRFYSNDIVDIYIDGREVNVPWYYENDNERWWYTNRFQNTMMLEGKLLIKIENNE